MLICSSVRIQIFDKNNIRPLNVFVDSVSVLEHQLLDLITVRMLHFNGNDPEKGEKLMSVSEI